MERFAHGNQENKERPRPTHLKVFRFRHGLSEYTELNPDIETNESDLTDAGREEVALGVRAIMPDLDKENDLIVLTSSPNLRARASKDTAREILEGNGFAIVQTRDDQRLIRKNIRAIDTLNEKGEAVTKNHPDYANVRNRGLEQLNNLLMHGADIATAWANHSGDISEFEDYAEVEERTNREIGLLFKLAHQIQKNKTKKQLVILNFEHGETLDPLLSLFSNGEISMKKGNGIGTGEPLRMDISVENDSIRVSMPMRKNMSEETIYFDRATKSLSKKQN